MARTRLSNPLALAVLTLLSERPMHPYEMSTTLRERGKEESIKLNFGSLYSVVESLKKRKLIKVLDTVREGNRPERTIYAITEAGTLEMSNWLSDLLSQPQKEFPQFEAALSLMPALSPKEVTALLEQRLMRLEGQERAYLGLQEQVLDGKMPRIFWIEAEYAFTLLKAEIAFVRDLAEELKAGRLDGQKYWQRMYDLNAEGLSYQEAQAKLLEEFKGELSWMTGDKSDE